jgi:hypothetical protein
MVEAAEASEELMNKYLEKATCRREDQARPA